MRKIEPSDPFVDEPILCAFDTEDVAELLRIRMDFLNEDFRITPSEEESLRIRLGLFYMDHLGVDFFAYGFTVGNRIVASAFLTVGTRPPNPVVPSGYYGYVSNVYTEPAYRCRGLASRLMKQIDSEAEILGLDAVELIATKMGRPVYEKDGYQPIGGTYMRRRGSSEDDPHRS
jgi:GNAT superfamily N-acetyltransferase